MVDVDFFDVAFARLEAVEDVNVDACLTGGLFSELSSIFGVFLSIYAISRF